jgi:hypothetical protein
MIDWLLLCLALLASINMGYYVKLMLEAIILSTPSSDRYACALKLSSHHYDGGKVKATINSA